VGCLEAFSSVMGIFLEGRITNLPFPVKMLNCYGPYKDRAHFLQQSKTSGCLDDDYLIIGGI
jgi:hypothetical protein